MEPNTNEARSRWSTTRKRSNFTFKSTDIVLLQQLNTYKYLPVTYIAALTKRDFAATQKRIRDLKDHGYLRVVDEITQRPSNNQQFFYELTAKGRAELREHYLEVEEPSDNERRYFEHQLMIDTTFASLQIAAEPRVVHPSELLARADFPFEQRNKKRPFTIPVSIAHTNKGKKTNHKRFDYTNDGLRSLEKDGNWLHLQIEAEHMNQVDCSNLEQQSFLRKFLANLQIMKQRLYEKHWGISNLHTLVVVPNQPKINTMKALILRETGGEGAKFFFLRVIPMFGKGLAPIEDIYTGAWQRAGHPDISLKELFDGRK